MLIFSPTSGRVSRITLKDDSSPGIIQFPGFDYASLHVILERVGMAFRSVYQVSDTLGDDILLMTFGESLSPITLQGVILDGVCSGSLGNISANDGVSETIKWWHERNLTKNSTPAQITIGDNYAMSVFIVDLNISVDDARDKIWRFNLSLLRIPERTLSEPTSVELPVGDFNAPTINPIARALTDVGNSTDSLIGFGDLTSLNVSGFNVS